MTASLLKLNVVMSSLIHDACITKIPLMNFLSGLNFTFTVLTQTQLLTTSVQIQFAPRKFLRECSVVSIPFMNLSCHLFTWQCRAEPWTAVLASPCSANTTCLTLNSRYTWYLCRKFEQELGWTLQRKQSLQKVERQF